MSEETNWEEHYQSDSGQLPWDIGTPSPELIEYFDTLAQPPFHVLEIGCGTGTNALWMAEKGCDVLATDISPTAIEKAKKKPRPVGAKLDFQVSNILEQAPSGKATVDFVFDRGVYHTMSLEQRPVFIDAVAKILRAGGFWLCLAGCADEERKPDEPGPPQLKVSELVDLAEKQFEIHSIDRTHFILPAALYYIYISSAHLHQSDPLEGYPFP